MEIPSEFYRDRRVMVLGGAGFVGVNLVDTLVNGYQAEVTVVDDFSRGNNYVGAIEYYDSDCSDVGQLREMFTRFKPDVVFNLAATVAGVGYNQGHNLEMFYKNLGVQVAPVVAASQCEIPHFLQVSSACVYAPGFTDPCVEHCGHLGSPVGANYGYAMAKRAGESAVVMSDLSHAVIVRPSNIYGPFDYFDDRAHVIPKMIMKALAPGGEFTVYGDGLGRREFLYVGDAARGMLTAALYGRNKEAYNLGTDGETVVTMRELAEMIVRECGVEKTIVHIDQEHDQGDRVRWSAGLKAGRELDWLPETEFDYGLAATVNWYRSYHG